MIKPGGWDASDPESPLLFCEFVQAIVAIALQLFEDTRFVVTVPSSSTHPSHQQRGRRHCCQRADGPDEAACTKDGARAGHVVESV